MTSLKPEFAMDAVNERDGGTRRTRLREFQAQLVERMQAASSGTQAQSSRLGVMIGQRRWLLNLQEAGEIVTVGNIARVPLTRDWYLGLTNIRGGLVSVVDLGLYYGGEATQVDKESRVVAFSPTLAFNCGLLVSRVLGLRNVAEMTPEPGAGHVSSEWAQHAYRDREERIWTEINLSLIVQDPQFLQVGL